MDSGEGTAINSSQQNQPISDFDSPKYRMDHKERGVAIIISNKFQNHTILKERIRADEDRKTMYNLFRSMGFEEEKILGENKDYGVKELKALFEEASKKDFTNSDCFACAILSYGEGGNIHCKNEIGQESEVEVDELLELIKGKKCQSLAGKPKLCFIQTSPFQKKVPDQAEGESAPTDDRKLPVEADFLKVHSSIPDICSLPDNKPSLFVGSLDKTVRKNWDDMERDEKNHLDILTLMTRVSKDLAQKIDGMGNSNKKFKIPYLSSTLTKELFFTKSATVSNTD